MIDNGKKVEEMVQLDSLRKSVEHEKDMYEIQEIERETDDLHWAVYHLFESIYLETSQSSSFDSILSQTVPLLGYKDSELNNLWSQLKYKKE